MESEFWEAVRQRAHALWLQDGCLEGRSEQHWQQAQQDVLESVHAASVTLDQPEEVTPADVPVRAADEHDAARQAQADALEIESQAKRRLADEYDAAQERGEVAKGSVRTDIVPDGNDVRPATSEELGLTHTQIHEARQIHDAEVVEPEPSVPQPQVKGTSLFKIRARQCRYVVSETSSPTLFCGAPTDGGSWCQEHRARVFVRSSLRPVLKVDPRKAAVR